MRSTRFLVAACLLFCLAFTNTGGPATAQVVVPTAQTVNDLAAETEFELSASEVGVASRANFRGDGLQVVGPRGDVTTYTRDTRFDSSDGLWLGYSSRQVTQVLRWPITSRGNLQIGDVVSGSVRYRTSLMQIRPVAQAMQPARSALKQVLPPKQFESELLSPLAKPTSAPETLSSGFATGATPSQWNATTQTASAIELEGYGSSDLFANLSLAARSASERKVPEASVLTLANIDDDGRTWLVTHDGASRLSCLPAAQAQLRNRDNSLTTAQWWIAPAPGGLVRMQTYSQGQLFAVSVNQAGGLGLLPLAQDPRQLWFPTGGDRRQGRFVLENASLRGRCLTHLGGGQLGLQPVAFAVNQFWAPLAPNFNVAFQPVQRVVQQSIQPNPPLPPAMLEIVNSHRKPLILLIGDSRVGESVQKIRIEPGQSSTLAIDRDAGASVVETYEIRSLGGLWQRQEFVTQIPPTSFYDISVYEEHLQSIAIDRTGKSPNPIEDVNYQPKSVGWLSLPPGESLPNAGRTDIYKHAVDANNPGAVRRFSKLELEGTSVAPDRLESILQEFQNAPRREF